MKYFLILATLVAMIAAEGTDNKVILRIKPISQEEYEAILKSDGEYKAIVESGQGDASQRAEGNLLSNALTSLSNLAASLSVSKYINSLFSNSQDVKSVGGYPLCSINARPEAREIDIDSYVNIDDMKTTIDDNGEPGDNDDDHDDQGDHGDHGHGGHGGYGGHGHGHKKRPPVINCVLVVDDIKPPSTGSTHRPWYPTTPTHMGPSYKPRPPKRPPTKMPPTPNPTEPNYAYPPWYPGGYPPHYYPPYGYHPPLPPYYYPPYPPRPRPENGDNEDEDDDEGQESEEVVEEDIDPEHHHPGRPHYPPQSIHSLLLHKLGEWGELGEVTSTTRRPHYRPSRRPSRRPRPPREEYKAASPTPQPKGDKLPTEGRKKKSRDHVKIL